jgi:hypothetical protein
MKKLKGLAFIAMLALSLVATTTGALAKDAKNGRETAWTDLGTFDLLPPGGVTWENTPVGPIGTTWEE